MSGYKVTPPDLETCKSFDVYLKKLKVWENTTPAPKDKLGSIIAAVACLMRVRDGRKDCRTNSLK